MAASASTKPAIDGGGASFDRRVLDESGAGTGPYQPVTQIARFDGAIIKSEWHYAAASGGIVNTTTAVTLAAAAGAGLRNYLASLDLSSTGLTTATEIAVRDGAAGTVLWRGYIGTAAMDHRTIRFDPPLKGSVNTLMEFVTLTAGGAAKPVYVNAHGFVAA